MDHALQRAEVEHIRPAGGTFPMAESASLLADCKAQRVAVTVELDAQQLLGVAGGFALHPNRLARSRPIDPTPLVDGTDQRLSRAPDESQRLSQLVTDHGGPPPPPAVERLGKRSPQRHPDLRIRTERVERPYIIGCGNSTCRRDACWPGRRDGIAHGLQIESAHRAFILDLGEEKSTDVGREHCDPFSDACAGVRAPSVDHDVAMLRVNCRDHAVPRQLAAQLRTGGGPQHDLARAGIEPGAGRLQRANPAADATGPAAHHRLDQRGVRALAEGGVEIHDGDLAHDGELLEALQRVSTIEHEFSSVPQLHGAAIHDVDAGHDHGRTGMPRAAAYALIPPTVSSPSCSTDAASTASAPASNASTTCVRVPIPPEAITGTWTALTTARSNPRSCPLRVPSASQLVSKISPAPRLSPSLAQPTASRAPAERPPTTSASHC